MSKQNRKLLVIPIGMDKLPSNFFVNNYRINMFESSSSFESSAVVDVTKSTQSWCRLLYEFMNVVDCLDDYIVELLALCVTAICNKEMEKQVYDKFAQTEESASGADELYVLKWVVLGKVNDKYHAVFAARVHAQLDGYAHVTFDETDWVRGAFISGLRRLLNSAMERL